MGEVEAEKLFKPITSGLREIAAPKMPLRRLPKKKRPVPDYGIAIDDEVPVFIFTFACHIQFLIYSLS